jgi:hypothetical protein
VDAQSERLGEEGMRLLFRLIAGESPAALGHVMIEPRLVMRDSTRERSETRQARERAEPQPPRARRQTAR